MPYNTYAHTHPHTPASRQTVKSVDIIIHFNCGAGVGFLGNAHSCPKFRYRLFFSFSLSFSRLKIKSRTYNILCVRYYIVLLYITTRERRPKRILCTRILYIDLSHFRGNFTSTYYNIHNKTGRIKR